MHGRPSAWGRVRVPLRGGEKRWPRPCRASCNPMPTSTRPAASPPAMRGILARRRACGPWPRCCIFWHQDKDSVIWLYLLSPRPHPDPLRRYPALSRSRERGELVASRGRRAPSPGIGVTVIIPIEGPDDGARIGIFLVTSNYLFQCVRSYAKNLDSCVQPARRRGAQNHRKRLEFTMKTIWPAPRCTHFTRFGELFSYSTAVQVVRKRAAPCAQRLTPDALSSNNPGQNGELPGGMRVRIARPFGANARTRYLS